jgi:hypothetical protein
MQADPKNSGQPRAVGVGGGVGRPDRPTICGPMQASTASRRRDFDDGFPAALTCRSAA